jgi:hypothetical protein
MFGHRFFGARAFGPRYFGDGGTASPPGASAAAVWSYVLSNGKSAGQNLVEVNTGIAALLAAPGCLETTVIGTLNAIEALRILLAVAAGKTTITAGGAGAATVEFRAVDDSGVTVTATMAGSERTDVVTTP